jgi:hypothetical protein
MINLRLADVERDGFTILPGVIAPAQVDSIVADLGRVLAARTPQTMVQSDQGSVYAARNLLTLWPPVAGVWRQSPLPEILATILGPDFGLVRVLFFDKPPDRTWSLPWHKDLIIAVQNNRLPSPRFGKPTTKAGVPHIEAPREVLDRMLTARIHLDDVTEENGPLKVLPGSHWAGKSMDCPENLPGSILVNRGDVLLIRPLVAHASGRSYPDTPRHRRILHLEFAADRELPDGYAWHDFVPG